LRVTSKKALPTAEIDMRRTVIATFTEVDDGRDSHRWLCLELIIPR
jgi:hypothetical protein